MEKIDIAFIGGSGLYKIPNFKKKKWVQISSSFGRPSSKLCLGELNKKKIAFLPRHGPDHDISPSFINYRANIEVLKKVGVQNIIALSAVGSLREDYKPGEFVVINQFIDKTYKREKTFFNEGLVVHIPMYKPVCDNLRKISCDALRKSKIKFHPQGTYVCIEGPQFSTLAESQMYRSWGCDVIGMTNMPEAKLALEAGICYASVAMITDYDCWHPNHENVTVQQIINTLNENSKKAFEFIDKVTKIEKIICSDETKNISSRSMITDLKIVKNSVKKKLINILK